jgi:hypothetical protein
MHPAVLPRTGAMLALLTGALCAPAADAPSDPAVPAAADRFRSTFSDYRPYAPSTRPPWRDVLQEIAPGADDDDGHEGHADHAGHGDHTQHETSEPPAARDGHEGRRPADAPPPAPAPVDHS